MSVIRGNYYYNSHEDGASFKYDFLQHLNNQPRNLVGKYYYEGSHICAASFKEYYEIIFHKRLRIGVERTIHEVK